MATYQMQAPDGHTYSIEGPDGATDDQVRAEIINQNPHLADAPPADKPATPQPSTMDTFLRGAALAGRGVAEGVHGAFMLPNTLGTGMQNLMIRGANALGAHIAPSQSEAERFSTALQDSGAYSPETPGENYLYAGTKGVAGALTGAGALGGATTLANGIRAGVAGATGSLASEGTRQAGGGPALQFGAGLVGGLAPSVVEMAASGIGRGIANAARPLSASGQRDIAAQAFAGQADDPFLAEQNLRASQPIVPGSMPTSGPESRDMGILATEKYLRSANSAPFATRLSEQNTARQNELSSISGSEADLSAAIASRAKDTAPLYDAARTVQVPVDADLRSLLQRPAMQRAVAKAREIAQNQGQTFDLDANAASLAGGDVQHIKLALNDMLATAEQKGLGAHEQNALQSTLRDFNGWTSKNIPDLRNADAAFAGRSPQINQMQILQGVRDKSQLTSADINTGQNFLGGASYSRALDSALEKNPGVLSSDQVSRLEALRTDIQRSQAVNGPLVKAPGSDTFQNLSMNSVLGQYGGIAGGLLRRLGGIYNMAGTDKKVIDLLTNATLDPSVGADFLRQAAASSARAGAAASARSVASGYGTMGGVFGAYSGLAGIPTPYITQ